MKLCEVAICLEDIQMIQSELNRFLVIVSERTRDSSKKSIVIKHNFHVFIAQAKIE
jgi:hypothetical protein